MVVISYTIIVKLLFQLNTLLMFQHSILGNVLAPLLLLSTLPVVLHNNRESKKNAAESIYLLFTSIYAKLDSNGKQKYGFQLRKPSQALSE